MAALALFCPLCSLASALQVWGRKSLCPFIPKQEFPFLPVSLLSLLWILPLYHDLFTWMSVFIFQLYLTWVGVREPFSLSLSELPGISAVLIPRCHFNQIRLFSSSFSSVISFWASLDLFSCSTIPELCGGLHVISCLMSPFYVSDHHFMPLGTLFHYIL